MKKVCVVLAICLAMVWTGISAIGSVVEGTPDVEETIVVEGINADDEAKDVPSEELEEEPEEKPEEESDEEPEKEPKEEPKEEQKEELKEEPKENESGSDGNTSGSNEGDGTGSETGGNDANGGTADGNGTSAETGGDKEGKETNGEASGNEDGNENDREDETGNQPRETTDSNDSEQSEDELSADMTLDPESESEEPTIEPIIETVDDPAEEPDYYGKNNENEEWIPYTGKEKIVQVREGITSIPAKEFMGNEYIEEIYLPATVEEIGEQAFAECKNLTTVLIDFGGKLKIKSKAFAECKKLEQVVVSKTNGQTTIEEVVFVNSEDPESALSGINGIAVAVDAFDKVKEEEKPEPTPTDDSWPDGYDPYDGIDFVPSGGGRADTTKKTTTTKKTAKHVRSLTKTTHDYDQIQIIGGETDPMKELKIGEDTLALSLKDAEGEAAEFTAAFAAGIETWDGTEKEEAAVDTLILKAVQTEGKLWEMNGTVLRQLNKSGIEWLTFISDETWVTVPTEGFLAGWEYEDLKRKGTAGRRFDYRIEPTEEGANWSVTVEGKEYELNENPMAPMYLTGIEILSGTERAAEIADAGEAAEAVKKAEAGEITGSAAP